MAGLQEPGVRTFALSERLAPVSCNPDSRRKKRASHQAARFCVFVPNIIAYSGCIADEGQVSAQVPQSVHDSGSIW